MVRWPGKIPAGVVSNEIVQHHDWLPTFLAAAGEPDIVEKLKKGHQAAGKTFKVHIDGYNLLPYLTGEETKSPRQGFIYFNDDGDLVALRFDNWKIVFMEQRCRGRCGVWAEPFVRCACRSSSTCGPIRSSAPTSRRTRTGTGTSTKAYLIMAAQAIVAAVPGDVQGVPAAPEGGELHHRPGDGEDGRRCERRPLMTDAAVLERHRARRQAIVAFGETARPVTVQTEERMGRAGARARVASDPRRAASPGAPFLTRSL